VSAIKKANLQLPTFLKMYDRKEVTSGLAWGSFPLRLEQGMLMKG